MSETISIRQGDLYCPKCLSSQVDWQIWGSKVLIECTSYCGTLRWPYDSDAEGRFTWLWDDEHPAPNPGCPWCESRNITTRAITIEDGWRCMRATCGRTWRGTWTRKNNDWRTDRWLIQVPVATVPWWSTSGNTTFSGYGPKNWFHLWPEEL